MKNVTFAVFAGVFLLLFFASCEDQFMTKNPADSLGKTNFRGNYEGPGSYTDHPNGDRYPYPEIIHKVYIPKDDLYDWKTLAWRITWPDYADGYDPDKIPTLFSLNGALNSFYYLNNVDPQNTYNTVFSLFHNAKVQRPSNLAADLDFIGAAPKSSLTSASFNFDDNDTPVDKIQHMVEQSPASFQHLHDQDFDDITEELEYSQGDFISFKLTKPMSPSRYGGLRIVSMEPRIIEVYVAMPQ